MKFNKSQALLLKLGAAKGKYRAAWRLIDIVVPEAKKRAGKIAFSFRLNRQKLREVRDWPDIQQNHQISSARKTSELFLCISR